VNGDPNRHFLNYPSLFLCVRAAVHLDGRCSVGFTGNGQTIVVLSGR
jgi:hypothetical protein